MTVVGVTGTYCSGKSSVTGILVERGFREIDVDRVGHEALAGESARVIEAFGPVVRADDGGVDRRALARVVFRDRQALSRLESILHPVMVSLVRERVEEARTSAASGPGAPVGVVINAAILFRMGLDSLCDRVIYVTAPFRVRWRRARSRDGATLIDVIRRLRSQSDVRPQFSRSGADILTVENGGTRDELALRLSQLLPAP